jgi:hypothetical protein
MELKSNFSAEIEKFRQEIHHVFEGVGSHCQVYEIRFHLCRVDSIAEEATHSLETSWSVLESEGHSYPFEETELECKSSRVSVFFFDLNFLLARIQTNQAVVILSIQISQNVFEKW